MSRVSFPEVLFNIILNLKEKLQIIHSFVTCSLNTADISRYIGSVPESLYPELGPGDRAA